ncbi:glycoside hydrolase family 43 protein [Dysgonomonas sp. OttesenSCG-928-D17]|nr:glycoside hydrolase family 43 protein [Dysgonomonas sp. OttesenSCG-928-D17]
MRIIIYMLLALLFNTSCSSQENRGYEPELPEDKKYFTNPIKADGADPWMIRHDGKYYLSESSGNAKINVITSPTITDMGSGVSVCVWESPVDGMAGAKYNLWGPHLNYVKGSWYIYYCAQSTADSEFTSQRMWALKSTTASPLGPYEDMGEVIDSNDKEWAIDGSIIERGNGDLYFVWSGIPDLNTLHQHTYIAKMLNPTRIDRSTIVKISSPTETWETSVRPIQEGQRPLIIDKNGKTIIMFSANGSWSDEYCLGSLTNTDGNYLNPSSWTKSVQPVFKKTNNIFGPGGASYVKSPDGTQDWIVYHSAKRKGSGWDRSVHTQKFTWDANGDPVFGEPATNGVKLEKPSGE